jgi:hypothetical protein
MCPNYHHVWYSHVYFKRQAQIMAWDSCCYMTSHGGHFDTYTTWLRAASHLEVGPFRCVKGLKSSLVIGQKDEIDPNPFTPRGRPNLVVWIFWSKYAWSDMARARWIGCTQNGGPMSDFNKEFFLIRHGFFQRTISVGLCGNLNGSMLDYARFVEIC